MDEGSRGASAIAAGFPDPADAARQLTQWGWQENAYRVFAAADQQPAEGISSLEVCLHRFADVAGAAAAMTYFAEGRAAKLGLESSGGGTLTGPVPGGTEITSYAQQGPVLIRITATGPAPDETGTVTDVLSLVREQLALQRQERYTSPQFGYEVNWNRDYMTLEGESSQPGISDELTLRSIEDPVYFVVAGTPAALPSIDVPEGVTPPPIYASPQYGYVVWRGALVHALYNFADDRAAHYPGSSVSYIGDWARATIRYTDADGTAWVENIAVAPFVGGDGLAFFVYGTTKELDEQYHPDRFWSIEVDLAAAADADPPTTAPWGLDGLAGSQFTAQELAAALPPAFSGAFGDVVLQETIRRSAPAQGSPEGTVYEYGPPGASEPTLTVVVNDGGFPRGNTGFRITPEEYIRGRCERHPPELGII